eukprot:1337473-Prymnesium_polylepis.1
MTEHFADFSAWGRAGLGRGVHGPEALEVLYIMARMMEGAKPCVSKCTVPCRTRRGVPCDQHLHVHICGGIRSDLGASGYWKLV